MLRQVIDDTDRDQHERMDRLGIPLFTIDMLKRVKDYDVKTPGHGIMTFNKELWGPDPEKAQLNVMKKFNTMEKIRSAFLIGNLVCTETLSGVVNHMAPGGQRMPELASVTLLEQPNGKRRQFRCYSSRAVIVSDYTKNAASDLELNYWISNAKASLLLFRIAIFLKPILHTLAVTLLEPKPTQLLICFTSQTVRVINDTYNALLARAGLPSCMYIRQVKEYWTKGCSSRISNTSAAQTYNACVLANHKGNTSDHRYGLNLETILEAHAAAAEEWHSWVLEPGPAGGGAAAAPDIYSSGSAATPAASAGDDSAELQDRVEWMNDGEVQSQISEGGQLPFVLRGDQQEALTVIGSAFGKIAALKRLTTAAIVTPTGSGKDLLPLAWSMKTGGTAIAFVPYKHLVTGLAAYITEFSGTAETFQSISDQGHNDSAANVVICAYEHAEKVVLLAQNLDKRNQLAGLWFNEFQVLDDKLDASYRHFGGIPVMFGLLARHKVSTVAVFMSATSRRAKRILAYCGLEPQFNDELVKSPIRDNLSYDVHLLEGRTKDASHASIMKKVVELINTHAKTARAVVFCMYLYEIDLVAACLRKSFRDRNVIEFDRDRRPDVTQLAPMDVVVATSALKTGTNMAETNLALLYGGAYSLEDWIQAAGRTGRIAGSLGQCHMICTDFSLKNAIRIAGDSSSGIEEVEKVVKGHPQTSVMDSMKAAFDPAFIAQQQPEKLTSDQSYRHAVHEDVHVVHRFLQKKEQVDLPSKSRCFNCGDVGHFAADCKEKTSLRVKTILAAANCCTNCGIPILAINKVELHPSTWGRGCTTPKVFLEGVFSAAEKAGKQPNLYLKELLEKPRGELIRTYANMCNSEEQLLGKRQRDSEHQEQHASQLATQPHQQPQHQEQQQPQQESQPQQKEKEEKKCICM